ncbi:MAG: hypothetical protein LBU30_05365 [Candidatus Methanoplasma sp.]|nr:hypothetical protein [Candidatus Methanoplasma sp.]
MNMEKNSRLAIAAVAVLAAVALAAVSVSLYSPHDRMPEYPAVGYGAVQFTDLDVYAVGFRDSSVCDWLAASTDHVYRADRLGDVPSGKVVVVDSGWISASGASSVKSEMETLTKSGSAVVVFDGAPPHASAEGFCYNWLTGERYIYASETFEPEDALVRAYNWAVSSLRMIDISAENRDFGYYSDLRIPLGPTVYSYGDKEGTSGWLSVSSTYNEILYGRGDGSSQYLVKHGVTVTPKSGDSLAYGSGVRSVYGGNADFRGHLKDYFPTTSVLSYKGDSIRSLDNSNFGKELFDVSFSADLSSGSAEKGFTVSPYAVIHLNGGEYEGTVEYSAAFADTHRHSAVENIKLELFTDTDAFSPRV